MAPNEALESFNFGIKVGVRVEDYHKFVYVWLFYLSNVKKLVSWPRLLWTCSLPDGWVLFNQWSDDLEINQAMDDNSTQNQLKHGPIQISHF